MHSESCRNEVKPRCDRLTAVRQHQRARGCTAEQTPTNMLLWCHLAQGRKQCSLSPLIDLLYLKPQLQRTLVSKANHVVSFRHVFQWKMKNVCWVWHWEAAFWFISEENSSFASLWCMDTNMAWYSNELHVQKPETTVLMHYHSLCEDVMISMVKMLVYTFDYCYNHWNWQAEHGALIYWVISSTELE